MKGMNIKIKRWGNGNGILLPKALLDMFALKADDNLSVIIKDEKIVLSPVEKEHKTLVERFAEYSGETQQKEFWNDNPTGKEEV